MVELRLCNPKVGGSNPSSSSIMETNIDDNNQVYYCKSCLSLRIQSIEFNNEDVLFCDKCKDSNVACIDFDTWDKMYFDKYHHHFMEEDKNGLTHKERMDKELREVLNLH